MSRPAPSVRLDAGMIGQPQSSPRQVQPGEPFRILVLGDCSGRQSRGICESGDFGKRRLHAIDRDNFEEVMATLAPRLHLALGAAGAAVEVAFTELDDFTPDAVYGRVPLFDQLRSLRNRLQHPEHSAAAIAELTGGRAAPPPAPAEPPPQESLLDSVLRATQAPGSPAGEVRNEPTDLVKQLIAEFVTPHCLAREDARVPELVADVERAIAAQMRALLHHPQWQDLEATWRSLYLLVRRLQTDRDLQIHVLDVTAAEIDAAFAAAPDALDCAFAKALTERAGAPTLVVSAFVVAATASAVERLAKLATVCAAAGSALLASATSQWVGCAQFGLSADPDDWNVPLQPDVQSAWTQLRGQPAAASVGLVLPRCLLRQPYGAAGSPVTAFAFEEEGDTEPAHTDLLWGSGAFLVALLLAQTWRDRGWQMHRLTVDEVAGLPVHIREASGVSEAVPCGEIELGSRAAQRIGALGMMPLATVRGSDSVRLGALQSIAANGAALAGRWHGR